jgi:hypothetical protein
MKSKILAVISARGRSKGILRKNIKLLCGEILIYMNIFVNAPNVEGIAFYATYDPLYTQPLYTFLGDENENQ